MLNKRDYVVHEDWITWQYDGAITLYPKLLRHLQKLSEDFSIEIHQGNHEASPIRTVNNKVPLISHWWCTTTVSIHISVGPLQGDPFPPNCNYLLPLPYHFDELLGIDHTALLSSQRENTSRKNVEGGNLRLEHRKVLLCWVEGSSRKLLYITKPKTVTQIVKCNFLSVRIDWVQKHVLPGQGGAFKGWLCPAAQKGQGGA